MQSYKKGESDWMEFGDDVVKKIAFLSERLGGSKPKLSSNLLLDLDKLSKSESNLMSYLVS